MERHWSKVEYLHTTVKNPNIILKGTHSYYSNAWTGNFEEYVVRYLYGDTYSQNNWEPLWDIDKLYIGDYVCIGAETIILMGGNNTHRLDWFSSYPFIDKIVDAYEKRGDTIIRDGVWLGMRSMIMPGVTVGEGAVIAANSIVTKDVESYTIVAGNPAKEIRKRFSEEIIQRLLELNIYSLPEEKFNSLKHLLCDNDIDSLEKAISKMKLSSNS
jgi:chloramphenicol O-acetyltransferase type B